MNVGRMIQQLTAVTGSPEQLTAMIAIIAQLPEGTKIIIPDPGTEARLNGVTPEDVSAAVRTFADGSAPTVPEICEQMQGNPKSGRDKSKITKILQTGIPEIDYQPSRRAKYVVRLNAPKTGDKK